MAAGVAHAYGVIRPAPGHPPRIAVRSGDRVVDLRDIPGVPAAVAGAHSLIPLLDLGRPGWDDIDGAVTAHLSDLAAAAEHRIDDVQVLLPVQPRDYVDFYASEHHATNVGRLFRPDGDPLLPNWRHVPVGYHGRAGSLVVSGTPVRRPSGVLEPGVFGPCRRLDLELELGFVVGTTVPMGTTVRPDEADRHVFGVVLVNDWSARDIQAFEYQPLGPFAGKSFATSIGGWITPLSALSLVAGPDQDPEPVEPLRAERDWAVDLDVAWAVNGTELGRTNARHLYWSFAQQLAHLTGNGAGVHRGDLFASGTISGPGPGEVGCLLERTRNGADPVELDDGSTRTWLEDGDEVTLTATWPGGSLAEVTGTVRPAQEVR